MGTGNKTTTRVNDAQRPCLLSCVDVSDDRVGPDRLVGQCAQTTVVEVVGGGEVGVAQTVGHCSQDDRSMEATLGSTVRDAIRTWGGVLGELDGSGHGVGSDAGGLGGERGELAGPGIQKCKIHKFFLKDVAQ